jgi:hypothetical protein
MCLKLETRTEFNLKIIPYIYSFSVLVSNYSLTLISGFTNSSWSHCLRIATLSSTYAVSVRRVRLRVGRSGCFRVRFARFVGHCAHVVGVACRVVMIGGVWRLTKRQMFGLKFLKIFSLLVHLRAKSTYMSLSTTTT